jgi:hypothetical protein
MREAIAIAPHPMIPKNILLSFRSFKITILPKIASTPTSTEIGIPTFFAAAKTSALNILMMCFPQPKFSDVARQVLPATCYAGNLRLLREIRRRTRVVGAFPDGQSAFHLAAARLRHVAGIAWSTKRYLNIELLKDQQMRDAITA